MQDERSKLGGKITISSVHTVRWTTCRRQSLHEHERRCGHEESYQVLNNIVTFWPSSAMVGPWETQQEFGEIFRHWSSDAYSGLGCCSREFLRRKWPAGWECIGSQ